MFGQECGPHKMLESKSRLDLDNIWAAIPNIKEPHVMGLFETFWSTAHLCFPILDEATVRQLYKTLPTNDQLHADRHNCVLAAIIFSTLVLSALYQRSKEEAEFYYWWACCLAQLDTGTYELEMIILNVLKASDHTSH